MKRKLRIIRYKKAMVKGKLRRQIISRKSKNTVSPTRASLIASILLGGCLGAIGPSSNVEKYMVVGVISSII